MSEIAIGLNAVILAVTEGRPRILTVERGNDTRATSAALPVASPRLASSARSVSTVTA